MPFRVVIVQAMQSTRDDHWYQWLAAQLTAAGSTVVFPAMPDPWAPQPEAWRATIDREVGGVDAETTIVAHSVGNAAVLQWLTALPGDWQLGTLINVGGFSDPQPGNDATPPFVRDIDHDAIRTRTARRIGLLGVDDDQVPPALSRQLAERLDAQLISVDGAGHFREVDGYGTFPLLLGLITDAPHGS